MELEFSAPVGGSLEDESVLTMQLMKIQRFRDMLICASIRRVMGTTFQYAVCVAHARLGQQCSTP